VGLVRCFFGGVGWWFCACGGCVVGDFVQDLDYVLRGLGFVGRCVV